MNSPLITKHSVQCHMSTVSRTFTLGLIFSEYYKLAGIIFLECYCVATVHTYSAKMLVHGGQVSIRI